MPIGWHRLVAASILGLGVLSPAVAQTLPLPGALTPHVAVRADLPGGPRTPATAVSATPPPGGVPLAEIVTPESIKDLTPAHWPESQTPVEMVQAAVPGHLNPIAMDEGGWTVNLEYLLLRPRRGAFDFALNDPARDLITVGKLESLNYELRTGVRAALGYRFGATMWDVTAEYTYFRSSAGRDLTAVPEGALYPTLSRPGFIDEANFAHADANIEYNVFDALIGRRYMVDEHLGLRMFGGLRFATIRQTETIQLDGIDARASYTQSKNSFDGFGPILGGEAVLAGWRGFHLYAKGSAGLLTGRTTNPYVELNNLGGTVYANIDYANRKVIPVAGIGLGGGWQYRQFSLRVGYEITNYFGLIDQPRLADDVSRGKIITQQADLSLEGLFAQLGFTF